MKNFDYIVIIGRMQPFHKGHLYLVNKALEIANKKVIIVLGSCFAARTIKNPFTGFERENIILNSIDPSLHHRITILHMRDYLYNDNMWLSDVQNKVYHASNESKSVALLGHDSDFSSEYLKQFPQWGLVLLPKCNESPHATKIRELLFTNQDFSKFLPNSALELVKQFKETNVYSNLLEEYKFIDDYKKLWERAPFPPTFVTVDSVVIKSGHVLIIKRKTYPGKGLYALPGGFLNKDESVRASALRELKEETKIKVPKEVLDKSIVLEKVFDHPSRSLRGRTITHCSLIDLGSGPLPNVKGCDDAAGAFWMPLTDVNRNEDKFFEDHWHIVTNLLHLV